MKEHKESICFLTMCICLIITVLLVFVSINILASMTEMKLALQKVSEDYKKIRARFYIYGVFENE